ncbi:hypothetical protein PPYR_02029 [Photinus pyralis]|uniref:Uncharacterized protein n=2 Tax=Photinus pyralis TaxID=7054 RepID=A0A5N4B626_PHOPY|nr:general transcriptional corepressor trfA-like [Photinus pyralis]XP_031359158.1 general transcriptional corepressor trfA-like [Photinus pyralis]KAB0790088.1 hypothetical protein PPYR_15589 [Photinus pyralis]KAB0805059.1 hypothetical protein PPYR_02029 [Photinus pyralis]
MDPVLQQQPMEQQLHHQSQQQHQQQPQPQPQAQLQPQAQHQQSQHQQPPHQQQQAVPPTNLEEFRNTGVQWLRALLGTYRQSAGVHEGRIAQMRAALERESQNFEVLRNNIRKTENVLRLLEDAEV